MNIREQHPHLNEPNGTKESATSGAKETPAPVKKYFDRSLLPDVNKAYALKDAQRLFGLTDKDMEKIPFTSVRNLSGPYPIRSFQGVDLQRACYEIFGGEEGFIEKLSQQCRYWRCDPINAPPTRYFVVTAPIDNLQISRDHSAWVTSKSTEAKLMQAFQEAEYVCLLFCPSGIRGYQCWGVMTTMPGQGRVADWVGLPPTVALGGTFGVTWNESTHINFRDLPVIYEDQDELLSEDGAELPTSLGESVVQTLASAVFQQELTKKRRDDRETARTAPQKERSRHRSRSPARRPRSRSPSRHKPAAAAASSSSSSRRERSVSPPKGITGKDSDSRRRRSRSVSSDEERKSKKKSKKKSSKHHRHEHSPETRESVVGEEAGEESEDDVTAAV